jgi:hypothetical protein
MINGAHAILYSDVAALQAEGIEIARPISDQSWGLLTAITLPGGIELGLTSPATRPRLSRPESQRSPSGKLAHACLQAWPPAATLPLWLGGHDFSRPNRRPSGMGGRRESGPLCQGGTRLHQPEPSAEPIWPAAPVTVTVASPCHTAAPVRS